MRPLCKALTDRLLCAGHMYGWLTCYCRLTFVFWVLRLVDQYNSSSFFHILCSFYLSCFSPSCSSLPSPPPHSNGTGVFISDVVKGGAADLDGRLMQGDQILSVNGEDMRQASQETVAAILKVKVVGGSTY